MDKRAALNKLASSFSKRADWKDAIRYGLMYGVPTLAGTSLGAVLDKKDRLRGGLIGGILGLGVGGAAHGMYSASRVANDLIREVQRTVKEQIAKDDARREKDRQDFKAREDEFGRMFKDTADRMNKSMDKSRKSWW